MDRLRSRTSVRTAVVWEVLRAALAEQFPGSDPAAPAPLDILDAGGGSGGFAVPLAQLDHRVTVVDPSPDSLAALRRRAAEAGVRTPVRAVQGDFANLHVVVPAASYDVVLCHSVFEVVEDPAAAMAAVTAALRPGGLVSILAANRTAAVVGRAVAGHFADARRILTDPTGRWGDGDALVRRFTVAEVAGLAAAAGLVVGPVHGIRVFTDLVPGGLLDADPEAAAALLGLEHAVTGRSEFLGLATQLHLLASRPR